MRKTGGTEVMKGRMNVRGEDLTCEGSGLG